LANFITDSLELQPKQISSYLQMTRQLYIRISLIAIVVFIASCHNEQNAKEKYCGLELAEAEVIKIKADGSDTYSHSNSDLDQLADITTEVQKLFNDTLEMEVFIFLRDKKRIGFYINGSRNPVVAEKISCLILGGKFDSILPGERYLLFYSNENSHLVAGIKTKK
jgi:hypothetical protein